VINPESAFQKSLLDVMKRSVSIIHWASAPNDHRNGSIFFVDTGARTLGVTARHVYEDYKFTNDDGRKRCKIDNLPFDMTARFISEGVECDIATFEVATNELQTLDRLTTPWPPKVPTVGQAVLLAGFPGCEKRFGSNFVDVRMYAAKWTVDSVNDRDISIVRPPDGKVLDVNETGFPVREYDFGGMSGGPVAMVEEKNICAWFLAGVIYECQQSLEIVKAARADFIDADGKVNV
jgi:hypothetical protein